MYTVEKTNNSDPDLRLHTINRCGRLTNHNS